jgi:hypothetical protein
LTSPLDQPAQLIFLRVGPLGVFHLLVQEAEPMPVPFDHLVPVHLSFPWLSTIGTKRKL